MKEKYFIHVDMDAFFASVEQLDHPEWHLTKLGNLESILQCQLSKRISYVRKEYLHMETTIDTHKYHLL